jgi:MEMO1 family protein
MAIPRSIQQTGVRAPRYAGTWYPGDAAALRLAIEADLARANPAPLPGRLLALVVPHAGHKFSGPVAAHACKLAMGQPFERVVLLGPLHRPIWGSEPGEFMVAGASAYATPLGQVPLDGAFLASLSRRVPLSFVNGDREHSLEIELPFLQVALGPFTLVPIMLGEEIGDPDAPERLDELAAALADLADERTLFVCSTDLSHRDDYAGVVRADRHMAELVEAFDLPELTRALVRGEVMACGATGLLAVLRAAQLRGATGARVLHLTNSGDITGDTTPGTYTVGYMAAAAYG